jgi:hypothetical protein
MFPDGQYVLGPDQLLLVVGKDEELARLQKLD